MSLHYFNLSMFGYNQSNLAYSYNANEVGKLMFSINTKDIPFLQICIIAFATTQGGYGIGVRNYTVIRTQSDGKLMMSSSKESITIVA